jgi:antitoxin PrlF
VERVMPNDIEDVMTLLEIEAAVTERGQTTVPSAIRHMLHVDKRDSIVWRGMSDGTVVVAKKPTPVEREEDPVIGNFLAFLANDMGMHPENIRPISASLVERINTLVQGVNVNLDAALPDDDE